VNYSFNLSKVFEAKFQRIRTKRLGVHQNLEAYRICVDVNNQILRDIIS